MIKESLKEIQVIKERPKRVSSDKGETKREMKDKEIKDKMFPLHKRK